jgi:hypothetical protein
VANNSLKIVLTLVTNSRQQLHWLPWFNNSSSSNNREQTRQAVGTETEWLRPNKPNSSRLAKGKYGNFLGLQ